jgi:hypothetical protein
VKLLVAIKHGVEMKLTCAAGGLGHVQVRLLVEALPQKNKWVFTNCNEKHALLALEALGLQVMLSFSRLLFGVHFLGVLMGRYILP